MTADPDSEPDPRTRPPSQGDEHATLTGFLRWHRETFQLKCAGLGAEQLALRSVDPSTMSLLGLVRHLAEVERGWFRGMMARESIAPLFCTEADLDGDFNGAVGTPECVAEAWKRWRESVEFAEQFVAEAPNLDITGEPPWGETKSLRWVIMHMIEEYARHNGHADLLRERIDGRVGS